MRGIFVVQSAVSQGKVSTRADRLKVEFALRYFQYHILMLFFNQILKELSVSLRQGLFVSSFYLAYQVLLSILLFLLPFSHFTVTWDLVRLRLTVATFPCYFLSHFSHHLVTFICILLTHRKLVNQRALFTSRLTTRLCQLLL